MPRPALPARLSRLARRLRRRGRPARHEHRYVVVVTYGRSGSTLVQGLLNTLPRTLVRGENSLYVLTLFRAMAQVRAFGQAHNKHHPRRTESAFFGVHEIKPRSFVRSARELVRGHLLGSVAPGEVDVLGFKEVLWHRVEKEETEDFFAYLDQVLPGCKYVLNEREPGEVVGSGFWQSKDSSEVLDKVSRVQEIQEFLRQTRPDRVLDYHYELVTHEDRAISDAQLKALAEFVHGSCDDALLARMRETLGTGHGPNPFGKSRGRRDRRRESRAVDGAAASED